MSVRTVRSLHYWSTLIGPSVKIVFFLTPLSFLWLISAKHNFSLELVLNKKHGPFLHFLFLLFPSRKNKWQQTSKSSFLRVADAESCLKWETGNYNPEYSPILAEAVNTFTSCTLLFRNSYNSAKLNSFTVERLNFFKKRPADSALKEDTFPPLRLFVSVH